MNETDHALRNALPDPPRPARAAPARCSPGPTCRRSPAQPAHATRASSSSSCAARSTGCRPSARQAIRTMRACTATSPSSRTGPDAGAAARCLLRAQPGHADFRIACSARSRRRSFTQLRPPIANARISTGRTCSKAAIPVRALRLRAGSTARSRLCRPASRSASAEASASASRPRSFCEARRRRGLGAADRAAGGRGSRPAPGRSLSACRSGAGRGAACAASTSKARESRNERREGGARGGMDSAAGMAQAARGAARLIAADDGPRIAALAFDGWDTHANEVARAAASRNCSAGSTALSANSRRGWRRTGAIRSLSRSPSSAARRASMARRARITERRRSLSLPAARLQADA